MLLLAASSERFDTLIADVVALVTGVAAVICAIGGVLLAIRSVRSAERKNAAQELDQTRALLDRERFDMLAIERWAYKLVELLTRRGIDIPPAPKRSVMPEGAENGPDQPGAAIAKDARNRFRSRRRARRYFGNRQGDRAEPAPGSSGATGDTIGPTQPGPDEPAGPAGRG